MGQLVLALLSGLGGTVIGCFFTWLLATQAARNQARREALVKAAETLQDYMVAYAQFYVEYLSPGAQAKRGHWAQQLRDKPDEAYNKLMGASDRGRGRLRVVHGLLCSHFQQDVITPICKEIMTIIELSGCQNQADCREIDRIANHACGLIPDLIKKYL